MKKIKFKTFISKIKFIDLFAGIGGFHYALHKLGAKCVYASEIDEVARKSYEYNFKKISPNIFLDNQFNKDIYKQDKKKIPNFDILFAGFPCQPFSQIGKKRGFSENLEGRGNLFFEISEILRVKKPKAFFLENVQYLINHDDGKTFNIIKKTINDLDYSFYHKIVRASDFNLPQHRPRTFMIGFLNEKDKDKVKQHIPIVFREKEKEIFNDLDNWINNYYMYELYQEKYYPAYKDILDEKIDDMCTEYFKSIIWCSKYYIDDCYNWKWYYKYSVGPSFKNLNTHIFTHYLKEELKSYESYEQLMIILPPKSYNLLKSKYKKILINYKHLSPLDFKESHVLKRYLWESEPIIPDFNEF